MLTRSDDIKHNSSSAQRKEERIRRKKQQMQPKKERKKLAGMLRRGDCTQLIHRPNIKKRKNTRQYNLAGTWAPSKIWGGDIGYYEYFPDFLEVRLAWTKQNSLHTFFSMAAHSCLAFPMLCSQLIMPFFWPPDERLKWNTHIQVKSGYLDLISRQPPRP